MTDSKGGRARDAADPKSATRPSADRREPFAAADLPPEPNEPVALSQALWDAMHPSAMLESLRQAWDAQACVRCMLVNLEDVAPPQRYFLPRELAALQALVNSEVERRTHIANKAFDALARKWPPGAATA